MKNRLIYYFGLHFCIYVFICVMWFEKGTYMHLKRNIGPWIDRRPLNFYSWKMIMQSHGTVKFDVAVNSVRNIVRQTVNLSNQPDRMTAPPNRYPCIQQNNCKNERKKIFFFSWKLHIVEYTHNANGWWMTTYTHDGISPTAAPLWTPKNKVVKEIENTRKKKCISKFEI